MKLAVCELCEFTLWTSNGPQRCLARQSSALLLMDQKKLLKWMSSIVNVRLQTLSLGVLRHSAGLAPIDTGCCPSLLVKLPGLYSSCRHFLCVLYTFLGQVKWWTLPSENATGFLALKSTSGTSGHRFLINLQVLWLKISSVCSVCEEAPSCFTQRLVAKPYWLRRSLIDGKISQRWKIKLT